ncbi:hypothetical protein HK097_005074, partial [Rhizophlyctis rosea]
RLEQKIDTISTNTSAIKTNTDLIPDIREATLATERIVSEIMVEGMDANYALEFIEEVTFKTKNPDCYVLVISELGKGFAFWMQCRYPAEYAGHKECFEGVTFRSHARILVEMLDGLQRAGVINNYKRNWLGSQKVVVGVDIEPGWRKYCPKFQRKEKIPPQKGKAKVKGKGKGKGKVVKSNATVDLADDEDEDEVEVPIGSGSKS